LAFERKTWIDRQAEFPARRKLNPTGTADVYDVSRDEGLILEEGDPFNAATMNALEGRIEAALNDTILPATCTYSSGVFTLTGLPTSLPNIFTVRFKAPADFVEGDTLSINALPYALFMPNQQPAAAGAFAQSAVVSLNIDLVAGKAFLAGGGDLGEYITITRLVPAGVDSSTWTCSATYNKKLGTFTCYGRGDYSSTGTTKFSISLGDIFTSGFFSKNSNRNVGISTTSAVRSSNVYVGAGLCTIVGSGVDVSVVVFGSGAAQTRTTFNFSLYASHEEWK
jgi:hypothetical protein